MEGQRAPGYLEIFLISLATILLEVSYTRVFSFKLVYYFTYLIIGISLLGLGAGGVFVAVSRRLRHTPPARLVSTCSFVAAAAVLLGYLVVAGTHLNAFELVAGAAAHHFSVALPDLARLTLICAALFTPFFAAGLAVATVFSTQTQRINRLYFADLLGAGLGCAVSVPLMRALSPPGCIQLAGLFFSLAAVRPAAARFRSLLIPIAPLAAALLLVTLVPSLLPDPVPDRIKTMSDEHIRRKVVFSRWSPVFRVDVVPLSEALPAISGLPAGSPPEGLLLGHDGQPDSAASLLGCEIQFENFVLDVSRDATALVANLSHDRLFIATRCDGQGPAIGHGLNTVQHHVQHRLFDEVDVDFDRNRLVRHFAH